MDFTGYTYISSAMVVIEVIVIGLTFRRDPKIALLATLASIGLKGQYLWLGKPFYAWQVSALLALAFVSFSRSNSSAISAGPALGGFSSGMMVYFTYSIFVSIPMWLLLTTNVIDAENSDVGILRVFTQITYLMFQIGLFWFGMRSGRFVTGHDFIRIIVALTGFVAYFAILQTTVYYGTGINLFPIIGSDGAIRTAFILDTSFRATSFSGEPKHLGILMSLGLSAYFIARIFRVPLGQYSVHLPIVMTTALFLSVSTTGIYLSAVSATVLAAAFFTRLPRIDLLLLLLLVLFGINQIGNLSGDFLDALTSQTAKRNIEVQDESVLQALFHFPWIGILGAGLGNIHVFAVDFLPANFPLFRDTAYKANTGLFYVLGDSGLFGLSLFILVHFFLLQGFRRMRHSLSAAQNKEAMIALALVLVSLASFLLRYSEMHFLIAGFVCARLIAVRHEAIAAASENPFRQSDGLAKQRATHVTTATKVAER